MKQIFDRYTNSISQVIHSQESWLTISWHGFTFNTIMGVTFKLASRSDTVNTDILKNPSQTEHVAMWVRVCMYFKGNIWLLLLYPPEFAIRAAGMSQNIDTLSTKLKHWASRWSIARRNCRDQKHLGGFTVRLSSVIKCKAIMKLKHRHSQSMLCCVAFRPPGGVVEQVQTCKRAANLMSEHTVVCCLDGNQCNSSEVGWWKPSISTKTDLLENVQYNFLYYERICRLYWFIRPLCI